MLQFQAQSSSYSKLTDYLRSCFELSKCFVEFGNYFERVPNYSIVSRFKKRRLRVFINHHHYLASIHSGKMLNGAGNSYRNIQIRSDCETRLSNVFVVRTPVNIGYRPGTSSRCTKQLCHLLYHAPVLRALQSATC